MPVRLVAQWLHLVVVAGAVVLLKVAATLITFTYAWFPFKGVLDSLYEHSAPLRRLFSRGLGGAGGPTPEHIITCPELITSAGYPVEKHYCVTDDGYVLGLHRIPHGKQHGGDGVCAESKDDDQCGGMPSPVVLGNGKGRPPVLLIHGLMMCSDVWVVSEERSLAFVLAEQGFDVFLGNNRGNRYSSKHTSIKCTDEAFWNFSVDELARYDVPAMVDFIINATGQPKVAIIGFSQGTAQTFAALSHDHALSQKVSCFAALSPAVAVQGLSRSLVSALVGANANFIYLVFGRKRIFPSTILWQRIMSTSFFVKTIDKSLQYLFSWDVSNISDARKPKLYGHIYSYSSVKCVVHWFQMIRSGRFQMFDDAPSAHRVPPQYDVGNITSVPVALFVGGKDTIIDPPRLIRMLPSTTVVHSEPTYEHLDFMWAENAVDNAYPTLMGFLKQHQRR